MSSVTGYFFSAYWFGNYSYEKDGPEEGKRLIYNLFLCQAIIISSILVIELIFFKKKPKTPPSYTS